MKVGENEVSPSQVLCMVKKFKTIICWEREKVWRIEDAVLVVKILAGKYLLVQLTIKPCFRLFWFCKEKNMKIIKWKILFKGFGLETNNVIFWAKTPCRIPLRFGQIVIIIV